MSDSRDETQIRDLIEALSKATRNKDADGVMSAYATDAVLFDLAAPLQSIANDPEEGRKGLEAWFATWEGPIGHETRYVTVAKSGHLALTHGFVRISGTKVDGQETSVWARQTLGLRNIGGAWKIIHEHTSTPFYMDGSLKAAVDLEP